MVSKLNLESLSLKEKEILEKVKSVIDPETGISIVERGLVDEIKVVGDMVIISYHMAVPTCPPIFAYDIEREIKRKLTGIEGISKIEIRTTCGPFY